MIDHHHQCCNWKVKCLYSHVNNGTWYIWMGNLCGEDVTMCRVAEWIEEVEKPDFDNLADFVIKKL